MSKVKSALLNRKRKAIEIILFDGRCLPLPLTRLSLKKNESILEVFPDSEIGYDGISCRLSSGREITIHVDAFYDYNRDPDFMRELIIYKLTIEAIQRMESSSVSKNEIIRRLGTSASQLARLLDPTNKSKSLDHMIKLLTVLGCEIEFKIKKAA